MIYALEISPESLKNGSLPGLVIDLVTRAMDKGYVLDRSDDGSVVDCYPAFYPGKDFHDLAEPDYYLLSVHVEEDK